MDFFFVVVVAVVVTGAAADAVITVGAGLPTVVKVVGVMTGAPAATLGITGFASATIAAVVVGVPFAGCFPVSNFKSCGQNRATEPIAAARTSAAIPMRNGKPLRACSGAALRSGGRLGLMFPGA